MHEKFVVPQLVSLERVDSIFEFSSHQISTRGVTMNLLIPWD